MTKSESKNSTDLEQRGKTFSIQSLVGLEKLDDNAKYDEILERVLNNITVASVSIYMTARDLSFANMKLSTSEWIKFEKEIPFSKSKINRLVQIGESTTLEQLNELRKLPDEWTTQHYISSLNHYQKKRLLESDEMSAGCSLQKIKSIAGVKSKSTPTSETFDIENQTRVLSVYVDKATAFAPKVLEMQSEIESLIDSKFHNDEQNESDGVAGVLQVETKLDEKNFIMIRNANVDKMLSRQVPTDNFLKKNTLESEKESAEQSKKDAELHKEFLTMQKTSIENIENNLAPESKSTSA